MTENEPPTEAIGYGSKWENFEGREWDWLESHRPDVEVRCDVDRVLVGHAWRAPDGQVWYRSGPYQGTLADWSQEGIVPVVCPVHGLGLLPEQYVADEVQSDRRSLNLLCTDPFPRYTRRS